MAGFTVLRTNHTSFTVSDLDRSIGFFRDCLGFELLSKAPRDPAKIQEITGVSGADIMVAYCLGNLGRHLPLDAYPGLVGYLDRLKERPAARGYFAAIAEPVPRP